MVARHRQGGEGIRGRVYATLHAWIRANYRLANKANNKRSRIRRQTRANPLAGIGRHGWHLVLIVTREVDVMLCSQLKRAMKQK